MSNEKKISPQGYNYDIEPRNVNPFWEDDISNYEIEASATVLPTTGTPSVEVETRQTESSFSMDFTFSGLKGEPGGGGGGGGSVIGTRRTVSFNSLASFVASFAQVLHANGLDNLENGQKASIKCMLEPIVEAPEVLGSVISIDQPRISFGTLQLYCHTMDITNGTEYSNNQVTHIGLISKDYGNGAGPRLIPITLTLEGDPEFLDCLITFDQNEVDENEIYWRALRVIVSKSNVDEGNVYIYIGKSENGCGNPVFLGCLPSPSGGSAFTAIYADDGTYNIAREIVGTFGGSENYLDYSTSWRIYTPQ